MFNSQYKRPSHPHSTTNVIVRTSTINLTKNKILPKKEESV